MSGPNLSIAFFLALRSIQNGNRFTLFLTITIMALVFVNLVFLPSIISGVIVNYNAQSIDYSFGNLVIEPKENEIYIQNVSTLLHKVDQIPDVFGTSPRIQIGATYNYRGKTLSGVLVGLTPTSDEQVTKIYTTVKDGEFLSDGDTDSIILGTTLAGNQDKTKDKSESLGGPQVGDQVLVTFNNGETRNLRVKGILSSGVYGIDQYGFITLREMEGALGTHDKASSVLVRMTRNGNEESDKLRLMEFGVSEQVRTYDEKSSSAVKDAVTAFGIINGISTGVSLVIAMVVTFIVVYINTINKRRQIGILKAIGIHKNTIVLSYLFQVMFMAAWGCIFGLILAFMLVAYLNIHPLVFPGGAVYPMVEAEPFIRSIILLFLVSLISGFIPSYQTSKEPILDAIRGSV
ncbi:MAG TPA: FtsX-like permease family protein [Methanospirillum sp.]|uniref:ABC transporter permease n=1 Tax=Methanospirillum sp. TaxID=45200 RepID=UPI002C7FECAA|nr:FtsX-like permease family protein [Methanospirillum sp.]HWQ63483.1 FtsX-like permease family protein [Methanospirillum sp.]